ncbi:efflux RND transporter permease subunit, partial [Klebsiella pneumoniae]
NKHENPGRFTLWFQRILLLCMRFRWVTIAATVVIFAVSLYGMGHVQQQFFPNSDRHELIVDWNLPQNASIVETKAQMDKFEAEQLAG